MKGILVCLLWQTSRLAFLSLCYCTKRCRCCLTMSSFHWPIDKSSSFSITAKQYLKRFPQLRVSTNCQMRVFNLWLSESYFSRDTVPRSWLQLMHGVRNVLISDVANGICNDRQIFTVLLLKPCLTQWERLHPVSRNQGNHSKGDNK